MRFVKFCGPIALVWIVAMFFVSQPPLTGVATVALAAGRGQGQKAAGRDQGRDQGQKHLDRQLRQALRDAGFTGDIERIYKKLGVDNRFAAILAVMRQADRPDAIPSSGA